MTRRHAPPSLRLAFSLGAAIAVHALVLALASLAPGGELQAPLTTPPASESYRFMRR